MSQPNTPPGELLTAVYKLIEERPRSVTLQDVADGAGVPMPWLKVLASRGIANPSVNRVEKLYTHLSGGALNV